MDWLDAEDLSYRLIGDTLVVHSASEDHYIYL